MGGGKTANGVVTDTALMLLEARQVTLTSPSRTRKSSVEAVSQSDIIVVIDVGAIRSSVALLIRHVSVGRGLPVRG